jgi:hypothetical protein
MVAGLRSSVLQRNVLATELGSGFVASASVRGVFTIFRRIRFASQVCALRNCMGSASLQVGIASRAQRKGTAARKPGTVTDPETSKPLRPEDETKLCPT